MAKSGCRHSHQTSVHVTKTTTRNAAKRKCLCKSRVCMCLFNVGSSSNCVQKGNKAKRHCPNGSAHQPPDAAESFNSEELWEHIWEIIEGKIDGRRSSQEAGVRRKLASTPSSASKDSLAIELYRGKTRIVGKQPPCFEIEVYRKRLNGKQPLPHLRSNAARGHYDILGLRRTASVAEIHIAYRRRALVTHPDKGGNPSDFHRVSAAYSELSDPARRAAYDRTLDFFGRKDGVVREDCAERSKAEGSAAVIESSQAVARVTMVRMMARDPHSWDWYLSQLKDSELNALYDVLQGTRLPQPDLTSGATKASQAGKAHAWIGPACISHHKSGYKVSVTWSSFCVTTGFTKILAQAIDWQIALLRLCSTAQARIKSDKRQSDKPVTEEELLQILKAEPTLELMFSAVTELSGKRNRKFSGPAVQDLVFALEIRNRFKKAASARNPIDGLERQRRQAEKEAVKVRQKYKKLERELLAATARQLHSRTPHNGQDCSGPVRKRKRSVGGDPVVDNSMQSAVVVFQPLKRVRGKTSQTELMLAGNCLTYGYDGKTSPGKFKSALPLIAVMGGA